MTQANSSPEALPMGVGKVSAKLLIWVALLGAVVCAGLYAYSLQLRFGEVVTNMRTLGAGGAPWGVYIAFLVYFIGLSYAGIATAALTRLMGIEVLKPFARLAEIMTLTTLVLGGTCILADLGDPLAGLINLPRYARISSPFFGTFTLVVGGFIFPTLVYLYLSGRADAAACIPKAKGSLLRPLYVAWASGFKGTAGELARHHRVSYWLALAILPIVTLEKSTLGLIFGIQGGRPGWFSALQAPSFVVLAAASGLGALMIVAAVVRKGLNLGERLPTQGFRLLGNASWVLILIYLYFMAVEEVTAHYAASAAEARVAHAVVQGAYAPLFWLTVLAFVVPMALQFVQFVRGTASIQLAVVSGLLVNVGAMLKRYLIVVPSQTHGQMLPWEIGHYVPNLVEITFIVSLFALGALMITFFVKVFPAVPLSGEVQMPEVVPGEPGSRRALRNVGFVVTLLLGVLMAVVGFAASARVGTSPAADPVIPFAPVLFIAGLMAIFYSAVVYEIFPRVRSDGA